MCWRQGARTERRVDGALQVGGHSLTSWPMISPAGSGGRWCNRSLPPFAAPPSPSPPHARTHARTHATRTHARTSCLAPQIHACQSTLLTRFHARHGARVYVQVYGGRIGWRGIMHGDRPTDRTGA